jgi:hypothetical protein
MSDTLKALLAAITAEADAAQALAVARRVRLDAMVTAQRAHQHVHETYDVPAGLNVESLDREIAGLLAAGGFVYPLTLHRDPMLQDATTQDWTPRRHADTPLAFVKRWTARLAGSTRGR